jgi:inhibitor of KinA
MIGFVPGFAYLGGMPEQLATPRRSAPRSGVPAGTVGIAGVQTGIYPIEITGGWQLIGRTSQTLFSVEKNPPSYLQAGDEVVFVPVSTLPQ